MVTKNPEDKVNPFKFIQYIRSFLKTAPYTGLSSRQIIEAVREESEALRNNPNYELFRNLAEKELRERSYTEK